MPEFKQNPATSVAFALLPRLTSTLEIHIPPSVQIYIARDGQQTGPVSMEDLVAMAGHGTVSASDLAWHEGLAGWVAVSEVLGTKTGAPVLSPPIVRSSKTRLGVAGFVIAVACVPLWFVILVIAGSLRNQSQYMAMLGFGLVALLLVNAVGLTLGLVALSDKDARKRLTIIGVSLNSIAIIGFVLLLIIGLAVK